MNKFNVLLANKEILTPTHFVFMTGGESEGDILG